MANGHTTHPRTTSSDFAIALVLFGVAMLMVLPASYKLSFDFSKYLTIAGGLFEGYGFYEPNGRPAFYRSGYTLTLGVLQTLFGRTVLSGLGLAFVATALLAPLTYLVGAQLHRRATGLVAAVLVLLSPNIITLAPRHLDPVWPALLLISLVLLLHGIRRQSITFLIFSAVVTAYAVSIKELSLLFVPAALLLMIIYRVRWSSIVMYLMTGLSALLMWMIVVVSINGGGFDPWLLVNYNDKAGDDVSRQVTEHGSLLATVGKGLWTHFAASDSAGGFLRQYTLGIVLCLSLLAMPIMAWLRGCLASRVLACLWIVFLPLAIVAGARDMRLMQTLWIQLIAFLAFAYLLVLCVRWLVRVGQFPKPRWVNYGLLLIVTGFIALLAKEHDAQSVALAQSARFVPAALFNDVADMHVQGSPCHGIARQLSSLDAGTPIYSDHQKVLETIRWEAPRFKTLKLLPHQRIDPLVPAQLAILNETQSPVAVMDAEHPSLTDNNRLKLWHINELNQAINQPLPVAIVISQRARGLNQSIRATGAFASLGRVRSRWQCWIYTLRRASVDFASVADNPRSGPQLAAYLNWLQSHEGEVFASLTPTLNRLGIKH